jgi:hypothetical protein
MEHIKSHINSFVYCQSDVVVPTAEETGLRGNTSEFSPGGAWFHPRPEHF